MLYAIPYTLLKVALNTNKTGHHVIRTNEMDRQVIRYN
jgi:hypothetical protein